MPGGCSRSNHGLNGTTHFSHPTRPATAANRLARWETLALSIGPSPLQTIDDPLLNRYGIQLSLKRDDLLHPLLSGNKWRKLKYLLHAALVQNCTAIASMGGIHSNHLHALAYAGKLLRLPTAAYLRGELPSPLTPTLRDTVRWGMSLHPLSRSAYRELRQCPNSPGLPANAFWLPEGGAHPLALQGVAELATELDVAYDWLCLPCGTATTLAGLATAIHPPRRVLGFAALKNAKFLNAQVAALLSEPSPHWQINLDYHFGGFARTTPELLAFIQRFHSQTGVVLEPIYTGKMLFGIYDLARQGRFAPGTHLIAVHTGGLQGLRGFSPCNGN